MRFIDEAKVSVCAGDGGDGCVAFRREAHVPRGGPSGGDGGAGGDIVIEVDPGMSTLLDLRYRRQYQAEHGEHGQGRDRYGRAGRSLSIRVPCGTVVRDSATGEVIADLTAIGQRVVVAKGGSGGRGNIHFASSTHRAPRQAETGQPGELRELRLELKLLAEVGVVGLPNAGKSTLIAAVSAARPKIADYPFTTTTPTLGVVSLSDERSFVMADIPGLIAGSAQGIGLGHRFLRHVERTRVLIYVLDDRRALAGEAGTPLEDLELLRGELAAYDPTLLTRPTLVVLNKIDLLDDTRVSELRRLFVEKLAPDTGIHFISGAARTHLRPLLEAAWRLLHGDSNIACR